MDILLQGIQQRSQPLDVIFLDLGDLGFRGLGFRGLGFRGFGFTVFEDVWFRASRLHRFRDFRS